jgi:hypothetical protein
MLTRARAVAYFSVLLLSSTPMPAFAQAGGHEYDEAAAEQVKRYLQEGRETFRFDTFGSEDFWGGQLKLHQAIAGEVNGGVGPGVSPEKALSSASRST